MKKVIIDPRSDIAYSSFYLYGLEQLYGRKEMLYEISPFRELSDMGRDLRFIIKNGMKEVKYFIHTNDSCKIIQENYDWCDVYGCVNANFTFYSKDKYTKLISLVPSFAIRNYNMVQSIYYALDNFLAVKDDVCKRKRYNRVSECEEVVVKKNIKRYFASYIKNNLYRRTIDAYQPRESLDDYVFFLSTLWYSDVYNKNDDGVNLRRANFLRACQKIPNIKLEGGLVGNRSDGLFADVTVNDVVPMKEWIKKTKLSSVVFNTPAFWDCHGWKLGEYLAMGKAIISTKLSNDLPKMLEHGINIHYVDNDIESMREAINYIIDHPNYKRQLEKGAWDYWEQYGKPIKSLAMLGILE